MSWKKLNILSRYFVQFFWLVMALISVVGFGFIYIRTLNPIKQAIYRNLSTKNMDSFFRELTAKQYDTQGTLIHYLYTPMVQHIPEKNTYLLKDPYLIITEANQAPWEIHANRAKAEADKTITLSQHVVIHQKPYQKKQEITVMTEEITYFPQKKSASTSKPVTIQQARNRVQAVGMNAYLADNKVELLSHVKGHYEPQKTDSKT